jgi:hypothetical protein
MAHHEQLGAALFHRLSVELQCSLVKPSRSGFQVVWEGEPQVGEFLDLSIVRAPQIYDVSYAQRSQFLDVGVGFDCASEGEPFAREESFHRLGAL